MLWLTRMRSLERYSERIRTFLELTRKVLVMHSICLLMSIKSRLNSIRSQIIIQANISVFDSVLAKKHVVTSCIGSRISHLTGTNQIVQSLLSSMWLRSRVLFCFRTVSWIQRRVHYPICCDLCLLCDEISAQKFCVHVLCGFETSTSFWWDNGFC